MAFLKLRLIPNLDREKLRKIYICRNIFQVDLSKYHTKK
jgi:hypothetical protein